MALVSRIPAISLLFAISVPPIMPLLVSTQPDSDLPACCRRDGKHHCSMMDSAESPLAPSGVAFKKARARCEQYPTAKPVPLTFSKFAAFTSRRISINAAVKTIAVVERPIFRPKQRCSLRESCLVFLYLRVFPALPPVKHIQ